MFKIFIFFRNSLDIFFGRNNEFEIKKKKIHFDRDTFYFENNSWHECQKKKKKKKNEITNKPNF